MSQMWTFAKTKIITIKIRINLRFRQALEKKVDHAIFCGFFRKTR